MEKHEPIHIDTCSVDKARKFLPKDELEGVIERVDLYSKNGEAQVYVYNTGAVKLIWGSRSLFNSWLKIR